MFGLFKNRTIWHALAYWAAFIPLAYYVPREHLFDVLYAIACCVGVGVLVAYGPGMWRSLKLQTLNGGHYLVLGIGCTWTATIARFVWGWAWRFLGRPDWMVDHVFIAFTVWVLISGGALHLTAKNAINGAIPKSNWLWLGAVSACGVALALLIVVGLDIQPARVVRTVPIR